ncbi:MAG: YdcF family protein [Candidatus Woesearchaeota archaeon]
MWPFKEKIYVVLGCTIRENIDKYPHALVRLQYVIKNIPKNKTIICSGYGRELYKEKTEAQMFGEYLQNHKFSHVLQEKYSRDTVGNAFFTKMMLKYDLKLYDKRDVYIITSEPYRRKAKLIFHLMWPDKKPVIIQVKVPDLSEETRADRLHSEQNAIQKHDYQWESLHTDLDWCVYMKKVHGLYTKNDFQLQIHKYMQFIIKDSFLKIHEDFNVIYSMYQTKGIVQYAKIFDIILQLKNIKRVNTSASLMLDKSICLLQEIANNKAKTLENINSCKQICTFQNYFSPKL